MQIAGDEISPRQLQELLQRNGPLASNLPARQTLANLCAEGLEVWKVAVHSYHAIIYLNCGPVLTVYTKGTALTQGNLRLHVPLATMGIIERCLPRNTARKTQLIYEP